MFFSNFKKHDFLRFFEMTYQKVVKSRYIIDFPNLGLTYNGGWCTATKTR